MNITYFSTFEELAAATSPDLSGKTVALSGGTTYAKLYPLWLAQNPRCEKTEFFPVDERMVPFEAQLSNWGTAYRLFLRHAGREADKENWPRSLQHYCDLLAGRFNNAMPVFDTVFLGVGNDGHTASLFPRQHYLEDYTSIVLQTQSAIPPVERVTLGPGPLAACRKLIVIVAGKGKEDIAKKLIDKEELLPVVAILNRHPGASIYIERSLSQ